MQQRTNVDTPIVLHTRTSNNIKNVPRKDIFLPNDTNYRYRRPYQNSQLIKYHLRPFLFALIRKSQEINYRSRSTNVKCHSYRAIYVLFTYQANVKYISPERRSQAT